MDYGVLVNLTHRIPEHYFESVQLIDTIDSDGNLCRIEESTYHHFLDLVQDASSFGISLAINSGYRSIQEQEELFHEYVLKLGYEEASKVVSKPYYSEHHTGLAIDVNIWKKGEKELLETNEKDAIIEKKKQEYEILHSLLQKHGFILRYPKGKESITGFSYEPWHIRYVGSLVSKLKDGMTLEEYYQEQNQE